MKYVLAFALVLAMTGGSMAAIHTETVEYKHGDVVMEGYLAYDDAQTGARPGVLVIHEWTGIGDYVKSRCRQLAELGYVAFAADIYGKGIRPEGPEAAGKEATKYRSDRALMRARAQAGLDQLKSYDMVDPARVAAIGYCFGGGVALELARSGADIAGVVSFHGNLDTPNPEDAKNIKGEVLVCHGGADPYVPGEQVLALAKEMNDAKVDWQLHMYGNAVHSFTNPERPTDPSAGAAYNEKADKRSWADMKTFFDEIFAK
jgi:dienelactone hydrolase